jgi:HlyD family secretion protein
MNKKNIVNNSFCKSLNYRTFFKLLQVKAVSGILCCSLSIFILSGCSNEKKEGFLGSAVVEGHTFMVATVAQGSLIGVYKDEGDSVSSGELLAVVDTIPLVLKKNEIEINIDEINANVSAKKVEINAASNDADGLQREFTRADTLSKKGALPTQQKDNLSTQYKGAKLRLEASKKTLNPLFDKIKGLQIKIDQINDQISKCYLHAQSSGIISTKYRNLGEIVNPGNPVYEIVKFDTLYADFFVPQPVLPTLIYGQELKIRMDIDSGKGITSTFVPGKVSWIGNEAEFSPKNIQTRESRNELVFKIRVTIENKNGVLKRGLPVEIWR